MNHRHSLLKVAQAIVVSAGLAFGISSGYAQKTGAVDQQCANCHGSDEQVMSITKTHHGALGNKNSPSCTSCHGASTAHIQSSDGKVQPDRTFGKGSKNTAAQRSEACLACHGGSRHLAFWDSGRHAKNEVSCNNCHVVHAPKNRTLVKNNPTISPYVPTARQLEYETCATCHKTIRSQLNKPSHHPIVEGKVSCSNCHNPHGALSPAMIKTESVNELCTSCHSEKRGPWINEHPPVEENCLACHTSHGSQHTKLLTRKVPNLCQDCHDWTRHPGTAYGSNASFTPVPPRTTAAQFVGRSCLNCHNQIHGSNAPSAGRGQFFVR